MFDGEVLTIGEARDKLHVWILDLKESCLLLDSDNQRDRNSIKMHDVVRDVSISIAEKDFNTLSVEDSGVELNIGHKDDLLKRCTAIVFRGIPNLSRLPQQLECPSLELCILSQSPFSIPNTFFEKTCNLKVLDMSRLNASTLPSSLSFLKNLQTFRVDYCYSLKDISVVGELKKLQILSFAGTGIEELPSEIGKLFELRLLDVSNCRELRIIPAGLIAGLSRLEELKMRGSFDRWGVEDCFSKNGRSNVSLSELNHLLNLTSLEIVVSNAKLLSKDLSFEKWEKYEIIVGDMWRNWRFGDWLGELEVTRKVCLQLSSTSINRLQHVVEKLFKRTECLCLGELKGVKNLTPELDVGGFQYMKHLRIKRDYEIQYIVNVEYRQHKASFPALESLHLSRLLELQKICNGRLMEESFYNLKFVKVKNCNRLESLFSFSVAIGLRCLQEIQVSKCNVLEGIVAEKNKEDDCVNNNDGVCEKIEFVQLHKLSLKCLPKLNNFLGGKMVSKQKKRQKSLATNVEYEEIISEEAELQSSTAFFGKVSFPKLAELELSEISNMTQIWSDKFSEMSCCYLTRLTVEKCDNLQYLLSSSVSMALVRLRDLIVKSCVKMKNIVAEEEGDNKIGAICFPHLSYLCLESLPNLTSFYSGSVQEGDPNESLDIQSLFNEKIQFPRLEQLSIARLDSINSIWQNQKLYQVKQVTVCECKSLQHVLPVSAAQSLDKLEDLWILDCKELKTIIGDESHKETPEEVVKATRQVATTFTFPKLARLHLEKLPKLKCFYPREHTTEWPVLEVLNMRDCDKISTFDFLTIPEKQGDNLFEKVISELEFMSITSQEMTKLLRLYDGHILPHLFRNLESLAITKFRGQATSFPSQFLSMIHNQLQGFRVYDCSFQEIFPYEGEVIDRANNDKLLPQLRELQLEKLPELKYICKKDQYSKFIPVLEELYILHVTECHLLTNLVPSSVSFKLLTDLCVTDCGGLINLIQPSTAASLEHLRFLCVSGCERIEEIIGEVKDDEEESSSFGHEIIFNNLWCLVLEKLPRLTNFSSSRRYTFNFPELLLVQVEECPNMKTFCGGITTTPYVRNVYLNESASEKRWEGELNTTIEQIYAQREAKRLGITIPSTSSNNDLEAEAQAHIENSAKGLIEGRMEGQTRQNANIVDNGKGKEVEVSNEVEEYFEKSQETPCSSDPSCSNHAAREQALAADLALSQHVGASSSQLSRKISNLLHEVSPLAIGGFQEVQTLAASTISPNNEVEEKVQLHDKPSGVLPEPGELVNQDQVCGNGVDPGKEIELCGKPIEGGETGEEFTGEGKEFDIGDKAIKPVKLAATCGKVQEQTIAVSQASRDVGASSSNSQQKDIQELHVTKHFIPLMSKVLEILQTRPLNSMSAQHIQFMEEASRDLSAMNFPMEWLCPYVDKAKKCLSVVDRTKAISEAELKIAEVEAQLQALKESKTSLKETKKALEEENKVIALSIDLDKPLYED